MSDLEKFKQIVQHTNPFESELLQEFNLVRRIKSKCDITDKDWEALMVEYDAAGIDWKGLWNEAFCS